MTVYGTPPPSPKSFMGHYRAMVIDVSDPMGAARIKVDVPAVIPLDHSSWAPVLYPPGYTPEKGPSPGDTCMVAFENGDPAYPIVVGFYVRSNAG